MSLKCPHCGKTVLERLPLTKKQLEVYDYIYRYTREYSYAPTYDEIAKKFGLSSLGSVNEHIENLARKGYIKREFNAARGIQCLVPPDEIGDLPAGTE